RDRVLGLLLQVELEPGVGGQVVLDEGEDLHVRHRGGGDADGGHAALLGERGLLLTAARGEGEGREAGAGGEQGTTGDGAHRRLLGGDGVRGQAVRARWSTARASRSPSCCTRITMMISRMTVTMMISVW